MSEYSICFVMPAYRRYELSKITFAQRAQMCDDLTKRGINANCVVIADDENLDIADEYDFYTVESDNMWLGKKFNDGHEFAAKSGWTHVAPVGSDMFIDPSVYYDIDDNFRATTLYAAIAPTGKDFVELSIDWGVLQYFPVKHMAHVDYRPTIEEIRVGCDTYTRVRTAQKLKLTVVKQVGHPLECVSFQSAENQITKFKKLIDLPTGIRRKLLHDDTDALLNPLKEYYPEFLVDKMIEFYTSGKSEKK